MSVVGFEIEYIRSTDSSEPPLPISSTVLVSMSVEGATIEHFGPTPITRAIVSFDDTALEEHRVGNLVFEESAELSVRLPSADFPAFWAALGLDRRATLAVTVDTGRFDVLTVRFVGQG